MDETEFVFTHFCSGKIDFSMNFSSVTFPIRIAETDAHHLLTIPALAERLQEIAWQHSETRDVDVPRLLERGVSWVLSRMRIEVAGLPTHKQTVTLKTWISAIDRYFYYREFQLTDADSGQSLIRVTSVWGVLDMVKRRVIAIPDFIRDETDVYTHFEPLPPASGKLPTLTTPDFSENFMARWHDLDANRHVNNTRYFQWLIEALPADFLDTHTLQQLDVIFRAEATLGEAIISEAGRSPSAPIQDGSEPKCQFLHRLLNQDGQLLLQARTAWRCTNN